ncbi:FAD-binding protein [Microbacterium profundi]|uniref:FAD-binding protein n=1 Tax=Microbacterium profundi TaxID=450380 RepID=UPI003558B872
MWPQPCASPATGTALCDGGIVIDLSAMRAVSVDPAERTADVQGGALRGDVDHETQATAWPPPAAS